MEKEKFILIRIKNTTKKVFEKYSLLEHKNKKSILSKIIALFKGQVKIEVINCDYDFDAFVSKINRSPVNIGGVYLESIKGNVSQITDSVTIEQLDCNHKAFQKTMVPILDPYGGRCTVTYSKGNFNLQLGTKIFIKKIYPKTTFQIHLFPAEIIDPSQVVDPKRIFH